MSTALARRTDPETSHEAAAMVNVNPLERAALIVLFGAPLGLTCSEIALKANYPRDSISPRMKRLLEKKLVKRTGEKRLPYPPHPDKKVKQLVWEIVDGGRKIVTDHYAAKATYST